jgi:hypothetical protein
MLAMKKFGKIVSIALLSVARQVNFWAMPGFGNLKFSARNFNYISDEISAECN